MNKTVTIITYLNTFFVGVAIGILTCVFPIVVNHQHNTQPINANNLVISTNLVENMTIETNRATTTTYKVDWFKDNSDYIWDGWKLR